jgi:prepilin-type N-terminal cleavage/methylation domain-containing protein
MSQDKGFTLAEMAVAVVILALLLFGAMVPFGTQLDIRSVADTRRTMDTIKDAIVGFAQANGRLPCPAAGSVPAGGVDAAGRPAGTEQLTPVTLPPPTTAVCSSSVGVVPWTTLGTPETDSWGRRFTYRVSPVFADGSAVASSWATATSTSPTSPANQSPPCAPNPAPNPPASFAMCTLGDIALLTRTVSQSSAMGLALPVIFVSHGKNGYGAWQPNGIRLLLPAAGTDEAANANGGVQVNPINLSALVYSQMGFYSRSPTPAAAGCVDPTPPGTASAAPLCEFDDLVVTVSSSTLVARMVAAGRLP